MYTKGWKDHVDRMGKNLRLRLREPNVQDQLRGTQDIGQKALWLVHATYCLIPLKI
jgi:hypothetical protein